MNPFLLPSPERLAHWKEFRRSLMPMPDDQKLREVAAYWAQAPLMTIAYDLDKPEKWPTPWHMIHYNEWCRSSVAIGMEATLRLAGITTDRLLLRHIMDRDIQAILMVLVVDSTACLNYDWGSVVPYPKTRQQVLREIRYGNKAYYSLDG
jgi:hypothetical protein